MTQHLSNSATFGWTNRQRTWQRDTASEKGTYAFSAFEPPKSYTTVISYQVYLDNEIHSIQAPSPLTSKQQKTNSISQTK